MGYHRAGFDVIGVDIAPQPRYPFPFFQADALWFLEGLGPAVDLIHASPPCQRFSKLTMRHGRQLEHPDLIGPVRELLLEAGVPYVIENVLRSPLVDAVRLCGSSFGLGVRRHRLFEASFPIVPPPCDHVAQGPAVRVYGKPGGSSKRDGLKFDGTDVWREAMGIDWMTSIELPEAIPPAYTEFVGRSWLAGRETAL